MLVNVLLPSGFTCDIEEHLLVKVTGGHKTDRDEGGTFEEYWIGHPAAGGLLVKRSASVTPKPLVSGIETGEIGHG